MSRDASGGLLVDFEVQLPARKNQVRHKIIQSSSFFLAGHRVVIIAEATAASLRQAKTTKAKGDDHCLNRPALAENEIRRKKQSGKFVDSVANEI